MVLPEQLISHDAAPAKVRETVRLSSPRQIEFKQRVDFAKDAPSVSYEIETYLFLPGSLQVNPGNFTSGQLLRNLKNYIRLRPPRLPLEQLAAPGGALEALDRDLDGLDPESGGATRDYENAVRRFALTFRQSVKAALRGLRKKTAGARGDETTAVIQQIRLVLKAYRQRVPRLRDLEARLGSRAGDYCDEFMSLTTSYFLRGLLSAGGAARTGAVARLWESEKRYRLRRYPESVPSSGQDNEAALFRWSNLRKFVTSPLFLEPRQQGGQTVLQQSLYGVAAAVSMLFATIVAFSWQGAYGSLSINLFWALIIAYIFKDRIKEWLRSWLYQRFEKWIPDRRLRLARGSSLHAGEVSESFRFIDAALVPATLRALRDQAHTLESLSTRLTEDILLYKKKVRLADLGSLTRDTDNSLLDITRLDVRDFLRYADTLFEELPLPEDDDSEQPSRAALGEKVYHLYVAQRIRLRDRTGHALLRLILNANGIKRLETVSPLSFAG